MRAGLLSTPEVIEALQRHYVCSWVLPQTLDENIAQKKDPELTEVSKMLKDTFRPLVEIVIFSPDGKRLGHLSFNEDILFKFPSCTPPDPELLKFFLGYLEEHAAK